MHGIQSPAQGRYAIEFAICQEMGWSYNDLLMTPIDFVDEIVIRLNAENRAERKWRAMQTQKSNSKNGQGKSGKGRR